MHSVLIIHCPFDNSLIDSYRLLLLFMIVVVIGERITKCGVELFVAGCFLPPPYVDAYGETDQGLRRGDPLHICDASRRKLELLWRSHGLYNEAAKYMENSQALVVTEWHHL